MGKISGDKFLCLSPMREVQKLKNDSNFTLILNYSMVVFLGILFENWKTFKKFFNPSTPIDYDQLMPQIKSELNRLVFPVLARQIVKMPSVIRKAQQLGN